MHNKPLPIHGAILARQAIFGIERKSMLLKSKKTFIERENILFRSSRVVIRLDRIQTKNLRRSVNGAPELPPGWVVQHTVYNEKEYDF